MPGSRENPFKSGWMRRIVEVGWGSNLIVRFQFRSLVEGSGGVGELTTASVGNVELTVVGANNPIGFSAIVGTGVSATTPDTEERETKSEEPGFPTAPAGDPGDDAIDNFFLRRILERDQQGRYKYTAAWLDTRAGSGGDITPLSNADVNGVAFVNCSMIPKGGQQNPYIDFDFTIPLGVGTPSSSASILWDVGLYKMVPRRGGGYTPRFIDSVFDSSSLASQHRVVRLTGELLEIIL